MGLSTLPWLGMGKSGAQEPQGPPLPRRRRPAGARVPCHLCSSRRHLVQPLRLLHHQMATSPQGRVQGISCRRGPTKRPASPAPRAAADNRGLLRQGPRRGRSRSASPYWICQRAAPGQRIPATNRGPEDVWSLPAASRRPALSSAALSPSCRPREPLAPRGQRHVRSSTTSRSSS